MHRENALDANSKTHAAHRERFAQQLAAAAHHDAFKRLDALFVAFALFQPHIDLHRVAGTEVWMILAKLRLLSLMHNRIHDIISLQTHSGGASTQRTIPNCSPTVRLIAT